MGSVAFEKYEGLGNDFVLVRAAHEAEWTPERVRSICDRHLGIGADGVLLILPAAHAGNAARMRVLNADGTTSEMCGNGLRCVVRLLTAETGGGTIVVETDDGPKRCTALPDGEVVVTMGRASVAPEVSVRAFGVDYRVTPVEVGNPHAVVFAEGGAEKAATVGAEIERLAAGVHPAFARGTNVEFVAVRGRSELEVHVWERGVGVTRACGTGACAAAIVAEKEGRLAKGEVHVRLPGGWLHIEVGSNGEISMRGPARRVFGGAIEL